MPEILNYKHEVYRKSIHIASSIIAILLWLLGENIFLPYLLLTTISFCTLDYLRNYKPTLQKIFLKYFGTIIRPNEQNTISGASWIFIGSTITIIAFDENIAIIALLIMSISDSVAAIIGIKYGRTKLYNKSFEGSIAFLLTTALIVFILSPAYYIINIIAILIATLIELISTPTFNDNLLIPISIGIVLTIGAIF